SAATSPSIKSFGGPPPGTFPVEGTTLIRFASGWTFALTEVCTPLPIATSRITAATPMMIPSMVSTERNRFARNPRNAIRRASRRLISHDITGYRCFTQENYRENPASRTSAEGGRAKTSPHGELHDSRRGCDEITLRLVYPHPGSRLLEWRS